MLSETSKLVLLKQKTKKRNRVWIAALSAAVNTWDGYLFLSMKSKR